MCVQLITAHTSDREDLRHQGDRWIEEVRPGAEGFLGGTVGTADDGTTIALIRFQDEAAARANSDRPEQRAWWEQTAKYYDVEPTFRESSDIGLRRRVRQGRFRPDHRGQGERPGSNG